MKVQPGYYFQVISKYGGKPIIGEVAEVYLQSYEAKDRSGFPISPAPWIKSTNGVIYSLDQIKFL